MPTKSVMIGRRDLLRGLGTGAALLAPFARHVKAWAAGGVTPNFFVFYTPNGHVRSAFGSTGSGAGFTLKASLAALEPWKSKLSVVSNLDNPGASSKGSHEDCVRTLTCMPGGDMYVGYGPSIDWVVGNHLQSRPLTMATNWKQAPNWQSKISWKEARVFDPHIDDATAIYNDIFGKALPTQNPADTQKLLAQGKSVLDFVREDIALLTPRLAAPDRTKLQNHLDALRQVEGKLAATTPGAACSTTAAKAKLDAGTGTGGDGLRKSIELKAELAGTAFACGTRRVATLLTQGASGGMNPLGGLGHHNISHYEGANAGENWKKIDTWYVERFAGILKRFSELGVLDTTVVAWATEISESHSQKGFVIPVAGGTALGIQPSQSLANKDTLSNLWVSVQKAMGISKDTFATGSSGGIPGLWKAV